MTQERTRRLAAVWFADIVGYTELSSRDEEAALRAVRELQRVARMFAEARGGRVVKLIGDAVLVVFDSVDSAVRAALSVRDAFLQSDEARSTGLSIRVAVHVGEVTEAHDGDVYGDAVNTASRIEPSASPGQVLVSGVAYQLLQQRATIEAEDLGTRELKGLPSPVRLYSVKLLGVDSVGLRDLLQEAIAPLQVLDVHGIGGMGEIYLARDAGLRRTLAVKVLRSELVADQMARKRFLREAQIIAGLSHPNVIGIHTVGELKDGTPYFVMDYVAGGSFADRLDKEGPLAVPEATRVLGQVASALAAAHERGVVHRDIKASNILFDPDSGRALVTDWGIAALDPTLELSPDARLTRTGVVIGSPEYMSPEQMAGDEVGFESDMYSLGLLAFELLTGEGPFLAATPRALMIAHLREDPPILSEMRDDVDPELEALVGRCLAKTPSERPTAAEFAKRFAPDGETVLEWPPPGLEGLQGGAHPVELRWSAAFMTLAAPTLFAISDHLWPALGLGVVISGWAGVFVQAIALVVAGILLVGGALGLLRGVRIAAGGAAAGYGWLTLLEVFLDRRKDLGALIAGTGEYAVLDPSERARGRKRRLVTGVTSMMVEVLLWPVLFVMLLLFVGRTPYGVLSFVLVVGLWACARGVLTLLSRDPASVARARESIEGRRGSPASLESIAPAWRDSFDFARAGEGPGVGPTGRSWLGTSVAASVAAGFALVMMVLATVVFLTPSGLVVTLSATPSFAVTTARYRSVIQFTDLTVESSPEVSAAEAGDLLWAIGTMQEPNQAWTRPRLTDAVIAGSVLAAQAGSPFDAPYRLNLDTLMVQALAGLTPAEQEYLRGWEGDPRVPTFDRLALASAYHSAGCRTNRTDATFYDLEIPLFRGFRETAYAKLAQAALRASEGRRSAAERSLREVISVGLNVAKNSCLLIETLVGTVITEMALDALAQLVEADDPLLAGRIRGAQVARDTATVARLDRRVGGNWEESREGLVNALTDSTQIRAMRWELLGPASIAYQCTDIPGLLFGLPPEVEEHFAAARTDLVRTQDEAILFDGTADLPARLHRRVATSGASSLPHFFGSSDAGPVQRWLARGSLRLLRIPSAILANPRIDGCWAVGVAALGAS